MARKTKSRKRRNGARGARRNGARNTHYGQQLLNDALMMASTVVDSRRHSGAQKIEEIATATRGFSDTVKEFPVLRGYVDAAADGLDEMADYVSATGMQDIVDDVTNFAKRQPAAAFALTLAAGVAATQLMRGWRSPRPRRGSARRTASAARH